MTEKGQKGQLNENDENLQFETSAEVKLYNTFDSMNLREDLLRGIYAFGNKTKKNFLLNTEL